MDTPSRCGWDDEEATRDGGNNSSWEKSPAYYRSNKMSKNERSHYGGGGGGSSRQSSHSKYGSSRSRHEPETPRFTPTHKYNAWESSRRSNKVISLFAVLFSWLNVLRFFNMAFFPDSEYTKQQKTYINFKLGLLIVSLKEFLYLVLFCVS